MLEFEKQAEAFETAIKKVINKLDTKLTKLLNGLDTKDGVLLDTQATKVLLLKKELQKALIDSGYYKLAEETMKDNIKIMGIRIVELKETLGLRLGEISKKTINGINKMSFGEMANIGEREILAIHNSIINSVIMGTQKTALVESLTNELSKFQNYAETYIRTSKRIFSQTIENNIAEQIDFGSEKDDIWEYLGAPLQSNSHAECEIAVPKRYFTNDEKIEFEAGSIGSLSFNPMRYNCLHQFMITNKTYKEATRD